MSCAPPARLSCAPPARLSRAPPARLPHALDRLIGEIRACRVCRDAATGARLAHEPRPVLRVSATARIAVCGQAPGTRVHASGVPFTDPSGIRLRTWMGVTEEEFYDTRRVAVVPMGFCFPGQDAAGADLPPRKECAPLWRARVFQHLPDLEIILLIGQYAQRWHLDHRDARNLTETVARWRAIFEAGRRPRLLPLPHPSWRNNAWVKKNPWFEAELLPVLRVEMRRLLDTADTAKAGSGPRLRPPRQSARANPDQTEAQLSSLSRHVEDMPSA